MRTPPWLKLSSSYSLLKFVYLTSQLRHSLSVYPLLRKILDPPLDTKHLIKNVCECKRLNKAEKQQKNLLELPKTDRISSRIFK